MGHLQNIDTLLCLVAVVVTLLPKIGSEVMFDEEKFTEYHSGNLNILLSVAHDGHLKPQHITDRMSDVSNNLKGDFNTRKFGFLLRSKLASLFTSMNGKEKVPFMILNNLHRVKMDPNRYVMLSSRTFYQQFSFHLRDEPDCCAVRNESSYRAYKNYHQFITDYFEREFMGPRSNSYKQALLIDIHGQSHSENWIELGYLLSSTQLDTVKKLTDYTPSSLNSLAVVSDFTFNDIIRGPVSLGAIMEQTHGLKVVPSPKHPSPNGANYYNGGFITKEYSSTKRKARINAIQLELPYSMRVDANIEQSALHVADSIYKFYMEHKLYDEAGSTSLISRFLAFLKSLFTSRQ